MPIFSEREADQLWTCFGTFEVLCYCTQVMEQRKQTKVLEDILFTLQQTVGLHTYLSIQGMLGVIVESFGAETTI